MRTDREVLRVDGISVVAVAGRDEARAIDPVPGLPLLSTLRVAEHPGDGFFRRVALGD